MPKTALNVTGKGYRSIGFSHRCPSCFSHNTYFSCSESAWVCYDCGEAFQTRESAVPSVHLGAKRRLPHSYTSADAVLVTTDFANLRARMGR